VNLKGEITYPPPWTARERETRCPARQRVEHAGNSVEHGANDWPIVIERDEIEAKSQLIFETRMQNSLFRQRVCISRGNTRKFVQLGKSIWQIIGKSMTKAG
jgi:hypothetical protein